MPFMQVVGPSTLVGRNVPFDQRPLRFADRAILKLRRDSLRRAGMASERNRARDRAVESMDHAKVKLSTGRLFFALAVEFFNRDFKTIDACWRLGERARRFIDDQARTVVEQDI